jgi:seryl-tRNA synthetase
MLKSIGNIVGPNVIASKTEDDNEIVRTWGEVNKELTVTDEDCRIGHLHHHEVMECLGIVELERGQKVAGHRGYYLKGAGVLLNQALINFGIATLMQSPKKYVPIQPPYFMKKEIMEATCQLDDFEENLYKVIKKEGEDCYYLTATSEQPISAMHMKEWMKPTDLP